MQQGAANKKVMSQKELAKQESNCTKKILKKTLKEKKVKIEKKSFNDFTHG